MKKRVVLGVVIILFSIFLAALLLNSFSVRPKPPMTQEEREADQSVLVYYETLRNVTMPDQTGNIVQLFTKDAVVTAPDGKIYSGAEEIKSFYGDRVRGVFQYDIKVDLSEVTVSDSTATVVYHTKSIAWVPGWSSTTINPPIRVLLEKFLLVREEGVWKIAGLVMQGEQS
jgi:ketosteroid isomerase-like protein